MTSLKKFAALLGAGALVFAMAGIAIAAPKDKVTICHATDSNSNPYVVHEPAADGDVSGHADHTGPVWTDGIDVKWGDIIPPFEFEGGSYPGLNWDAAGMAIYENDCQTPGEPPDPSTPPSFAQSFAGETDAPSEPNTATLGGNGTSGPADGAWLLVVALGVLLASIVVLTPARAKSRR